jgi:hypothetical protein
MALGTRFLDSQTLLVHDGELGDVRDTLCAIDAPFIECRCIGAPNADSGWDLILASPRRMLEIDSVPDAGEKQVRIAICENYSRTLATAMRRTRVNFIVRRPVHPEALRLLILQALYSGRERRRAPRVSVGAPIHFRVRTRLKPAVLLDLSTTGCRITAEHPAQSALALTLVIPAGMEEKKTFSVRGLTTHAYPSEGAAASVSTFHVNFERLATSDRKRLAAAVESFSGGPARLPATVKDTEEPEIPTTTEAASLADSPIDEINPDNRKDPRRMFDRRVIVMSEKTPRVLMGCDISVGGIRVEPDSHFSLQDELSIALPLPARSVPLVVKARVIRDDADVGLVLQFQELCAEAQECLHESLGLLPICDSTHSHEEPAWLIVSEILDKID